jgi:galactokinase
VQERHTDFDIQYAKLADIHEYLKDLPTELQPYFEAAIHNHEITQAAYQVVRQGRMNHRVIGALMTEHHKILRDLLKITTPKIDAMIDAALEAGAYGAKIVGSGGGGSICAIAPENKEEAVLKAIQKVSGEPAYGVQVTSVIQGTYD